MDVTRHGRGTAAFNGRVIKKTGLWDGSIFRHNMMSGACTHAHTHTHTIIYHVNHVNHVNHIYHIYHQSSITSSWRWQIRS